jgi:hypothetical protein
MIRLIRILRALFTRIAIRDSDVSGFALVSLGVALLGQTQSQIAEILNECGGMSSAYGVALVLAGFYVARRFAGWRVVYMLSLIPYTIAIFIYALFLNHEASFVVIYSIFYGLSVSNRGRDGDG